MDSSTKKTKKEREKKKNKKEPDNSPIAVCTYYINLL